MYKISALYQMINLNESTVNIINLEKLWQATLNIEKSIIL